MASDYFLKLDGIKGESQDAKHKDEIELIAFNWGVTNSATTGGGGGGGAGKATLQDLEVAMPVNRSSPQLFLSCATGKHIKEGTLAVRRSGGKDQVEYLKIKFTDILVSAYEENGNVEEDRPLDVVRFNFSKIEMTYQTTGEKGGAGASETVGWDLKQNKSF